MIRPLAQAAVACCFVASATIAQPLPEWEAGREVGALAANLNGAIQACEYHLAASEAEWKNQTTFGVRYSLKPASQVSPELNELAGFLGKSQFYEWFDPHASIWILASTERKACRIAVSNSKFISRAGSSLSPLILEGGTWSVATDKENPYFGKSGGNTHQVYVQRCESCNIRPTLVVTEPREGQLLTSQQQMLVTISILSKE
ncbi:hypothetical protein EUV02_01525 [Polymorphobacter arshaanensis]|uniref:Uncharacterized protein n=1 Tax=Glacieibacterium arshaanense TaxID=2511025 RepID=A0A4Y9EQ56_9SPHN|nr:hypothetical protein [Polymorphobacter arshaanensis]TFU05736.1 hypothetical protein EUV02_01525 [Polymorphobacter arshaanensis]